MQIQGIVRNGSILFESGIPFSEGTRVIITAVSPEPPIKETKRIQFPLVESDQPGSLALTNERIAEIFEEEDLAPMN